MPRSHAFLVRVGQRAKPNKPILPYFICAHRGANRSFENAWHTRQEYDEKTWPLNRPDSALPINLNYAFDILS